MNSLVTDSKNFESDLAVFWFDEDGILCAVAKNTPRTLEKQKQTYELIRQVCGNKKTCLLSDATHSAHQDKGTREYVAKELPNLFKAMAIISRSHMGRRITNFFLSLKQPPIPIKLFANEKEAKEWLKQFL